MAEVDDPPLLQELRSAIPLGDCTAKAWSVFLIYTAVVSVISSVIVLCLRSPFWEFWRDASNQGWMRWIPVIAQDAMYSSAPVATIVITLFLKDHHENLAREVASHGRAVCNCACCGDRGSPGTLEVVAKDALECWAGPPSAKEMRWRVYTGTGVLIAAYVVMDFVFLHDRVDYALGLFLSTTAWGPCIMGLQHAVVLMRHSMQYKIARLQSEWLALSRADCGNFQDFRAPYLRCWQEVEVLNQQWNWAGCAFVLWLAFWIVSKGGIAVALAVIGREKFEGHELVYLMLLVQLTVFTIFLFHVLFKVLQTNSTTDKLRNFILMYLHPSGSMDLGLLYRLIDDRDLMLKVLGVRLDYNLVVSLLVTVAGAGVGSLLKFLSDLHAAGQAD